MSPRDGLGAVVGGVALDAELVEQLPDVLRLLGGPVQVGRVELDDLIARSWRRRGPCPAGPSSARRAPSTARCRRGPSSTGRARPTPQTAPPAAAARKSRRERVLCHAGDSSMQIVESQPARPTNAREPATTGALDASFETARRCALVVAASSGAQPMTYDLVVYGGTSAGIIAAVQAKRMGKSVVVVAPGEASRRAVERRARVHRYRRQVGDRRALARVLSAGLVALRHAGGVDVAEARGVRQQGPGHARDGRRAPDDVDLRAACGGEGLRGSRQGVSDPGAPQRVAEPRERRRETERTRSPSITTLSGRTYPGRMFIDATYEGDLMAAAGVGVSRRPGSAGDLRREVERRADRRAPSPPSFRRPQGDRSAPTSSPAIPKSGLLPRISATPPGEYGQADRRIQAYCYRMCLTDHPGNRIPFEKPEGLRPPPVRAAAAGLRGRLARDVPEVRSDSRTARPTPTIMARSAPTTSG